MICSLTAGTAETDWLEEAVGNSETEGLCWGEEQLRSFGRCVWCFQIQELDSALAQEKLHSLEVGGSVCLSVSLSLCLSVCLSLHIL